MPKDLRLVRGPSLKIKDQLHIVRILRLEASPTLPTNKTLPTSNQLKLSRTSYSTISTTSQAVLRPGLTSVCRPTPTVSTRSMPRHPPASIDPHLAQLLRHLSNTHRINTLFTMVTATSLLCSRLHVTKLRHVLPISDSR